MLERLPDNILRKEKEIIEKSREADKKEVEVKATVNSYEFQIAAEMTEVYDEKKEEKVKKKKFKNDLERSRELDKRLVNNTIYNENKEAMANLRKDLKDEEIMLAYLKRRFRAACGMARLGE